MRTPTSRIVLRSSTTECSISLLTTSQPSPIAENGPMKLSTTRVSLPIVTGPRIDPATLPESFGPEDLR